MVVNFKISLILETFELDFRSNCLRGMDGFILQCGPSEENTLCSGHFIILAIPKAACKIPPKIPNLVHDLYSSRHQISADVQHIGDGRQRNHAHLQLDPTLGRNDKQRT